MNFHSIDLAHWNRAKTYQHFMSQVPCTYSICVNLDITQLMEQIRQEKLKFFPVLLYGLSLTVNRHQEFRMDLDPQGNPGYYDLCHPSYTVFHPQTETFTTLWTQYSPDFWEFYHSYLQDRQEWDAPDREKPPVPNIFNVSCIPWVSFTGFHLSLEKGYDYLQPILTVGRYFEDRGRLLLPLAIQVHHGVCDGFHAARFAGELQQWAEEFSMPSLLGKA